MIATVSFGKYLANKPCVRALLFFFIFSGGAPDDLPPCKRHLPFAIEPFLHGVPALVFAPHLFLTWGLFCIYIRTYLLVMYFEHEKSTRLGVLRINCFCLFLAVRLVLRIILPPLLHRRP